ncbi:MAG: 4Fe-4S binding protein [Desulfobacteraceae bacterium]|nr:4Fe-4S binding protein [Desulfobacteraceae bacterium]
MSEDVYRQLAKHLDDLPGGFPPAESGVELSILKRLFSPEQAELAVHLTLIPEEARGIAERGGLDIEETAKRLQVMARKGLIFSIEEEGRPALYQAASYIFGIWEYQLNNLNKELAQEMDEYGRTLGVELSKFPQLRTIPVGRSIPAGAEVLPHEAAEELVRAQKKILVAPCICRRKTKTQGAGCDKPDETCLIFDQWAEYYHRNGLGRIIEKNEAVEILKKADEAGLVLQPSNCKEPGWICCCCACCCGVVKRLKAHPRSASIVVNSFVCRVDPEICEGCLFCIDRCPTHAHEVVDDRVVHLSERCIGCGLCVTTCSSGAATMIRKPEGQHPGIPQTVMDNQNMLAQIRGKLDLQEVT